MGIAGYRRLLQIASLDGLVEASQLSRTLGGVSNEIHAMMTRLLVEEYGGGRLSRKHSSYFRHMLEELDISALPEAHFALVPASARDNNHVYVVRTERFSYACGACYQKFRTAASIVTV